MTWTWARGIGAGEERFVRGLGAPQVWGAAGKEEVLGVLDGGGAQGPVTVRGRRPEGPRRARRRRGRSVECRGRRR